MLTKVSRAALAALNQSEWYNPLPFHPLCPVCYSPLRQTIVSETRHTREFACQTCKFWVILEDENIRSGIEESGRVGDEGYIGGRGYGLATWNPISGDIEMYCSITDRAYLRGEPVSEADKRALAYVRQEAI